MKFSIPKDRFQNYTPPRLLLCNPGGNIVGEIRAHHIQLTGNWSTPSELSFEIDRYYVDQVTGETLEDPMFDQIQGLRQVYIAEVGYFVIQDSETEYSDKDTKSISCKSLEYLATTKYLDIFKVNTGEADSVETMYAIDHNIKFYENDDMYTIIPGREFDPFEKYYYRKYTDTRNYIYQQIGFANEEEFLRFLNEGGYLYTSNLPTVKFYSPHNASLSLLHIILEEIPEWSIGEVDQELCNLERKFDEQRISVYDFLMNNLTEAFKCVVVWDCVGKKINFYKEVDESILDNIAYADSDKLGRFDSDVFISKENLANSISIKYSTDDIKTKVRITGDNDESIREVNLGRNYLMNLDYYANSDWMSEDLLNAWNRYLKELEEYQALYKQANDEWVAAYAKYDDLMNHIPAEPDVLLVGDKFTQLYCIYPEYSQVFKYNLGATYYVKNADFTFSLASPQPNISNFSDKPYFIKHETDMQKKSLITTLDRYGVRDDIKGDNPDNVLLRIKSEDENVEHIFRVLNMGTTSAPDYKINFYRVSVDGTSGSLRKTFSLDEWMRGELTIENPSLNILEGSRVSYIGIMGAYLCIALDETKVENLQQYGVRMLEEKEKVYSTVFRSQTEFMFSEEGYQCVVSESKPSKPEEGMVWLNPLAPNEVSQSYLNKYTKSNWVPMSDEEKSKYNNYSTFKDNYDKLLAVRKVLADKKLDVLFSGYGVITNEDISMKNVSGKAEFSRVFAQKYMTENYKTMDTYYIKEPEIPAYAIYFNKFEDKKFLACIKDNYCYLAYYDSICAAQVRKDWYAQKADMRNFFTDVQWKELSQFIREDELTDNTFFFTGYESEEERLKIYNECIEHSEKKVRAMSQPSLSFSANISNLLFLKEFEPILNHFELGNYIRVGLGNNLIKKVRLLSVKVNFDDFSDIDCDFGNLTDTSDPIWGHGNILRQAIMAGRNVTSLWSRWQRNVNDTNDIANELISGLPDGNLAIGKSSGLDTVWDDSGLWGRKQNGESKDEYEDEQFRIINNKLMYSDNGFQTAISVFDFIKKQIESLKK